MHTKAARWKAHAIPPQHGRVAIVTGANSGIGLETARQLARHGATVVLACRDPGKAETARADLESSVSGADVRSMQLDLADLEAVRSFAQRFASAFDRLDLLVNNAGVMAPPKGATKQGFELQIGVNHFGHFALTGLLLPRLMATGNARIVNLGSQAHRQGAIDFDDLDWKTRKYKAMPAYGDSKLACLLFSSELARRLRAAGSEVKVVAAHPGWTGTDLSRHMGILRYLFRLLTPLLGMRPSQGALPTLRAATDPEVEAGDYFGPHGLFEMRGYPTRVEMAEAARDLETAARLWRESVRRTGVDIDAALAPVDSGPRTSPT